MIRTEWKLGHPALQTAIAVMRHRESLRRITLVAVVHVGRREYFAEIQRLIDGHEAAGGIVLYEGLGSLSAAEIAGLPPRERAVYRTLAPLHELYAGFARTLDLVFQGDALLYNRERWINADLPLRELLSRWVESGAPLLPLGDPGSDGFSFPTGSLSKGMSAFALLQTPLMLNVLNKLHDRIPSLGRLRELLLSDRNRAALDAIEAADPGRDLLIIYGAGHMQGIGEGLERRAYGWQERRWLTAFGVDLPWSAGFDALGPQIAVAQRYWRAVRGHEL